LRNIGLSDVGRFAFRFLLLAGCEFAVRGYLVSLMIAVAVLCVVWIGGSLAVRDAGLTSADGSSPPAATGADPWRRTVNGWERMSNLQVGPRPVAAQEPLVNVHPLVVGSFELLLSLAALLTWPPPKNLSSPCTKSPASSH
jgi:hypothetical protein